MVEVHYPLIDYRNIGKPDNFKWVFESHSHLKGGEFFRVIKEYLLATNISHCLDNRKTTPPIDSIFKDFQKNYENSLYTAALRDKYNKQAVVSLDNNKTAIKKDPNEDEYIKFVGKRATDISGTTPEGHKLYLSDFIGKVIFLNVWASWCGPCREEVPHEKKLIDQFAGVQDVVFLNISIDNNINKWKHLLSVENPRGIQIIVQNEQLDILKEDYLITYIPRYMLIARQEI